MFPKHLLPAVKTHVHFFRNTERIKDKGMLKYYWHTERKKILGGQGRLHGGGKNHIFFCCHLPLNLIQLMHRF